MSNGAKPTRQDEQREPVIEDAKLPAMPDEPDKPRRSGNLMAAKPKAARGVKRAMDPLPKKRPPAPRKPPAADMKPSRRRAAAARPEEEGKGYVRLRVNVEGDQLKIAGATPVEGPVIAQEEDLGGELAFEVSLGDKRIALGSIPDAGTLRSFPSPDGPPELRVHNVIQPDSFEFVVRVPAEELPKSALRDLNITLYRLKATPPDRVRGSEPLRDQLRDTVRPVASLEGVKLGSLGKRVRGEIDRALR